jgi:LuxR family transcriptional regulator, quorum-sensing system regulator SolR
MNGLSEADCALLDAIMHLDDADQAFALIAKAVKELGFDYCSYGIKLAMPVSRPAVAIFDTYPAGWMDHYRHSGYLAVDPTVGHASRSNLPLVWSDTVFSPAHAFWEDAKSCGLRVGWAQPSRDPSGAFGLLSLCRNSEPLKQKELDARAGRVFWLSQIAHEAIGRIVKPKLVPETTVHLTPRERDVLRWLAEGKTSYEIGLILNIAERTAVFHTNNAVSKLKATNRMQAVVKASLLGLLSA